VGTDRRTRRIGLLAPMRSELKPLARQLDLRPHAHPSGSFHAGEAGATDLVASLANIGTAQATAATTRLLDAFDVDHVFVVGIAGGIDPQLRIGEPIAPEVVVDWSTGREFHPTHLGPRTPRGGLLTADELLYQPEVLDELRTRDVIAVDMETAAVAAVCDERGVPWSVFRAISDRADEAGVIDEGVMAMIDVDGSARPAAVARYLLTRPHRIPHLVRLGRGSQAAARSAAAAAARALA
jgi:adenosylhomocysteine nucleosidase